MHKVILLPIEIQGVLQLQIQDFLRYLSRHARGEKEDWVIILGRSEKLKQFGEETTAWCKLLQSIISVHLKIWMLKKTLSSGKQSLIIKMVEAGQYGLQVGSMCSVYSMRKANGSGMPFKLVKCVTIR